MLRENLKFIDSLQFMNSSLENLVKNLPSDAFRYTSAAYDNNKLESVKCKGAYPDDFMYSFDRFNKAELPDITDFFSVFNNKGISTDDYQHAQNVWNKFNLTTMGDYYDLYLKSDVPLQADVFEKFRKTCLEYNKLDPCPCFTSTGLSWDAM